MSRSIQHTCSLGRCSANRARDHLVSRADQRPKAHVASVRTPTSKEKQIYADATPQYPAMRGDAAIRLSAGSGHYCLCISASAMLLSPASFIQVCFYHSMPYMLIYSSTYCFVSSTTLLSLLFLPVRPYKYLLLNILPLMLVVLMGSSAPAVRYWAPCFQIFPIAFVRKCLDKSQFQNIYIWYLHYFCRAMRDWWRMFREILDWTIPHELETMAHWQVFLICCTVHTAKHSNLP